MKDITDMLVKLGVPLASFYALYLQNLPWVFWPPIAVGLVYVASRYDGLVGLLCCLAVLCLQCGCPANGHRVGGISLRLLPQLPSLLRMP